MKNGRLIPSETWAERISRSGYSRQNVNCLVKILMEKEIHLLKQPEDYHGPFKVSYYYPESPSIASDFATIQELADERRIRVVFTRCNPAAGDPSGCYDVEFIPLCIGESPVVVHGIKTVKGTRVGTKSDGQVKVDDNGYVMGSSEKGAYFRVHASKSETDQNLGLHIQLVFENGEIRYSTHHENRLLLILFNDTNTETIGFDALKRLPDPPRELPFWSDSFIHLHDDWCALIKYGHSSPKLADLSSGLHIQEIIEAF